MIVNAYYIVLSSIDIAGVYIVDLVSILKQVALVSLIFICTYKLL